MTRTLLLLLAVVCTILALMAMCGNADARPRGRQCRYEQVNRAHATHREVVKTVRCAGRAFGNRADVRRLLQIGRCESGLTAEKAPHSTSYHGTFQYAVNTFHSQQRGMPAVVHGWDLARRVHNMRANVVMASAWIVRRTAAPWACA